MKHTQFAIYFFLLLSAANPSIFAQSFLKGKVIDSKNENPIPFVNVFIDNTTYGTVSDVNGEFKLKVNTVGVYDLIVSFVGYNSYKSKISVTSPDQYLGTIRLAPSETQLNSVEVQGTKDTSWEKKLKKFKKIFLGDDAIAEQCVIKNPWIIEFQEDSRDLRASANSAIEIENQALGYKLNFYLTNFRADANSYLIQGNAQFELLKSDNPTTLMKWETNREKSYYGSSQHLFKSIISHGMKGEGFNAYTDMLGFENSSVRSSSFKQDLNKTIVMLDTSNLVSLGSQKDIYKISWKGRIELHYRKEKVAAIIYNDIRYPISWITLKKKFILVNKDGVPLNPSDIEISGAMSKDRVAHMLPLDFSPTNAKVQEMVDVQESYKPLYEKLYVHTDKPYYYPGETIWFKGYVNYSSPVWRDSLSTTAYVELIQEGSNMIVQTKTLKIDSGSFHSDFILPDTLKIVPYFLRAYTNWNRNYGEDHLYVKYIPLLNIQQRPAQLSTAESSKQVTLNILADQESYQPREKINLTFQLKDAAGSALKSDLSISVTDANQVLAVQANGSILEDFRIQNIPKAKLPIQFPIEYGISFSGQLLQDFKPKEKTVLNVIQLNARNFFTSEADDRGLFKLSDIDFYDTSTFSVKIATAGGTKLRNAKKIKLLPRDIPTITLGSNYFPLVVEKTNISQRDNSTFELSANTKLLKEVVVNDTKLEETSRRPYGKPDYVIKAKDLNTSYGNLLTTLPGKVPGLVVRQDPNGGYLVYIQRAASGSLSNVKQVTVTVNDSFVGGSPADILSSINPANVESIEIKNSVNVLYGDQGGSGIVAVYTKRNIDSGIVYEGQSTIKVAGFTKPRIFLSPDYHDPKNNKDKIDYRSLLFWNPRVSTDSKTGTAAVSFYASDLTGQYRVVVEGVSEKGEPIYSEYMIHIDKK